MAKHGKALTRISERLIRLDQKWALTGGMNHYIQGVRLNPGDIDIMSTVRGIYKIEEALHDYLAASVEYKKTLELRSYFAVFKVDGVKVDVFADIENKLNNVWEKHKNWQQNIISFRYFDIEIPVLSLSYELTIYEKLKLLDRVARIKAAMAMP